MRFEREGKRPDGAPVKLGFSLAFADDRLAPEIHFATCQQHYPENFWNPAFQKHANGAVWHCRRRRGRRASRTRHRDFHAALCRRCAAADQDGGFAIATPRGAIDVMTPAAFLGRFGVAAPDVSRGARLAALRFAVTDREPAARLPEQAGLAGLEAGNRALSAATTPWARFWSSKRRR